LTQEEGPSVDDADDSKPLGDGVPLDASSSIPSPSKFRQLKDLMWVRETLEDLTAAEFALSVEQAESTTTITAASRGGAVVNGTPNGSAQRHNKYPNGASAVPPPRKKKRAVDYEKLLSQLTKRAEDMTCVPITEKEEGEADAEEGNVPPSMAFVRREETVPVLDENRGMGRFAYSREERAVLLE
jgi:hypothetical protein